MNEEMPFTLPGPAGPLNGRLAWPQDRTPVGIALVCHPHPLHGGSLQNKVVYILARALVELGLATARFDFRGVGASTGQFDNGEGEQHDALAVASWLQAQHPGPLWLAGFSFGAAMAWRISQPAQAARLILVAPALRYLGNEPAPGIPTLVVQGGQDTIIAPAAVEAWALAQPTMAYHALAQADHFFHGCLPRLRQTVTAWARAYA